MTSTQLQNAIERHFADGPNAIGDPTAMSAFLLLRAALESGEIRAASPDADSAHRLARQRLGQTRNSAGLSPRRLAGVSLSGFSFVDKSTFPMRHFTVADGVRVVPGGSSVRSGAYVARSVVCMPPMYINAGAWVDEGTMVDSHALVGSCAQVGKRVHLSAAAQIGGVLEPINASPVVIEDDVLVGGNCGVYEGTIVRKGAVLAAGTILTRGTPVFDLVNGEILRAQRRVAADHSGECGGRPRLPRRQQGQGPCKEPGVGPEPLRAGDRQVSRRKDGPEHGFGRFAALVSVCACISSSLRMRGFTLPGCSVGSSASPSLAVARLFSIWPVAR